MKKMNSSTAIRIIYRITNIGYWIFAVVATAVFIGALILVFNGFKDVFNLKVNLPLEFHTSLQGEYKSGETGEFEVEIGKAMGSIYFPEVPDYIRRVYGIFMILLILPLLYFAFHFRRFIKNIYQQVFFGKSNIRSLKRMALALFFYWLVLFAFDIAGIMMFHDRFVFDGISVADKFTIGVGFSFEGGNAFYILAVSVFIWLLSVIFRHGANIQAENELTI